MQQGDLSFFSFYMVAEFSNVFKVWYAESHHVKLSKDDCAQPVYEHYGK